MSGDKRKLSSLDSFVTITQKTLVTSSSSQQTESVQSELVTYEIDQSIDGELEESENTDSFNVNQNLIVVDSHPDTHDNDIGFQLSLGTRDVHRAGSPCPGLKQDRVKFLLFTLSWNRTGYGRAGSRAGQGNTVIPCKSKYQVSKFVFSKRQFLSFS